MQIHKAAAETIVHTMGGKRKTKNLVVYSVPSFYHGQEHSLREEHVLISAAKNRILTYAHRCTNYEHYLTWQPQQKWSQRVNPELRILLVLPLKREKQYLQPYMAGDDSLLLSMSALVSPIAMVSVTITRRSLLLLRAVSTSVSRQICYQFTQGHSVDN